MKIRKATQKDLKNILELMMIEFSKPPFKERVNLSNALKSLRFYFKIGSVYLAIENKEIAGIVIFKIEQYWEGAVMIVEDLAIKEKFKNRGIKKSLIKFIEDYAKKKGLKSISFSTHKKSNAINFCQKQGYKLEKNTVFMRKYLK